MKRKRTETIVKEILAERYRQIATEGWTPAHDDDHELGEMALAAASYAKISVQNHEHDSIRVPPGFWPWSASWWKPKNQRRDLVRAAALIVAEIERLDRLLS